MRVIAGIARSLPLKTVKSDATRPTTDRIKETLFNMLNPYVPEASFLDLFSGSGGIGIEALSRGASEAVFVEREKEACLCIEDNLKFTKLYPKGTLLKMDVFQAIDRLEMSRKEPFDIIFMDPPYDMDLEKEVLSRLSNSSLVSEDTLLIFEASKKTDVSDLPSLGYDIFKQKIYKTNQHVWVYKRG